MFHCCSFQYDCTAVGRYYGLYFSLTVASFPHSSGLEGSVRNPSLFMVMSKASVLSVRVTHLTKLLWDENRKLYSAANWSQYRHRHHKALLPPNHEACERVRTEVTNEKEPSDAHRQHQTPRSAPQRLRDTSSNTNTRVASFI